MKGLMILFVGAFALWTIDLGNIRQQFEQAKSSKEATEALYQALQGHQKGPVILAYKGASITLKARYEENRETKKEMVSEGIQTLEKAVKSSPQNVEIRLVRLAIQEHSPKVLKYKMNIAEDKQMILSNFASENRAVKTLIKRYVGQSKVFTAEERSKLAE